MQTQTQTQTQIAPNAQAPIAPSKMPTVVRAVAKFESTDETEMGFDVDALIAVTNEDDSGWWYGFTIPEGFDPDAGSVSETKRCCACVCRGRCEE